MNENTVKGKWLEIKGEVQKAWGLLTNDELDKTAGDMKAISGLIQQKYGDNQAAFKDRLAHIFNQFEGKKEKGLDAVKKNLKDSIN